MLTLPIENFIGSVRALCALNSDLLVSFVYTAKYPPFKGERWRSRQGGCLQQLRQPSVGCADTSLEREVWSSAQSEAFSLRRRWHSASRNGCDVSAVSYEFLVKNFHVISFMHSLFRFAPLRGGRCRALPVADAARQKDTLRRGRA